MESSYHNPVFNANFPDPFVLKYCGEYWAYCTGPWHDGRWFGVLRSRDLATWEEIGGAMEPLPGRWPCQWAPEVSYHNGRFYLYYSLGDETTMQLRVAVGRHPAGPFIDSGHRLSRELFAIDAHVFVDADGSRHLFYATDYLDHSHVGTGTARVPLADLFTPAGEPVPVTRARYDWQVYHPNRPEKGGVRWHTVEGPFVLAHKGRYYQMFSGGNWQNPSYGVSYAVAERIDQPGEWPQHADGERVLPILRTIPGAVIGPGHNSAVRGPDNRQLFCVYHRWAADGSGRVMAIDPLDWAGERMLLLGPSTEPRPLTLPSVVDFFDGDHSGLGEDWEVISGSWRVQGAAALELGPGAALARCRHDPAHYLAEISLRALDEGAGGYGVMLGDALRLLIHPEQKRASVGLRQGQSWQEQSLALPPDFEPRAFHLLRVEVNAGLVSLRLDESALRWSAQIPPGTPLPFGLYADGVPAAFAGFALSAGWLDLFEREAPGWEGSAGWQLHNGELRPPGPGSSWLRKGPLPPAYELTVNIALDLGAGPHETLLIAPAAQAESLGLALELARSPAGWSLTPRPDGQIEPIALPPGFDPATPQQLRFRVAEAQMAISWEGVELGVLPAPAAPTHIGIGGTADARFEMVRVTAL